MNMGTDTQGSSGTKDEQGCINASKSTLSAYMMAPSTALLAFCDCLNRR